MQLAGGKTGSSPSETEKGDPDNSEMRNTENPGERLINELKN